MNKPLLALIAGLITSTAIGQSQIVFTTSDTRENENPGTQDFIGLLDVASPGAFQTLFTNADADSRLRRIVQNGGGDSFFVGDSPSPTQPDLGSIFQFDGLLGGSPSQSTIVGGGGLLLDPGGIAVNTASDYIVFNNNPSGTGSSVNPEDGIFVANRDGSGLTQILAESASAPFPRFQAGTELRQSRSDANTFFAVGLNGGADGPSDSFRPSAITTVTVDPGDFSNSSVVNTIGLDSATTGLDEDLRFVLGFTQDNDGNMYFSDSKNLAIYRATLNSDGDGFDSFEEILDTAAAATAAGLRATGAADLEFDPFRNKLVFTGQVFLADLLPGESQGIGRIMEINLDGSGYNVLLDDVYVEDLVIIPAPSSAALLGLASLIGTRRRR